MIKTRIRQRGFTIVELLIVVVVIAILAAITIVAYNGITGQARKAAIQSSLSQLARKAQMAQLSGESVTGLNSNDISADMMDYIDYRKTPSGFCASYANGEERYRIKGEGGIESGDCEGTVSTFATLPSNQGNGIVIGHDKMLYVTAGSSLLRINRQGDVTTVSSSAAGEVVSVTPAGDIILKSETAIYTASPTTGASTLIAGHAATSGYADGTAGAARFNGITDVAVGPDGTMYVADSLNYRIRKVAADGTVTTLAGAGIAGSSDGLGVAARFRTLSAITFLDSSTLIVRQNSGLGVRFVTTSGVVTTPAGVGVSSSHAKARFKDGTLYVILGNRIDSFTFIRSADGSYVTSNGGRGVNVGAFELGYIDGVGATSRFSSPVAVAIDVDGAVYVVDRSNSRIRKIE